MFKTFKKVLRKGSFSPDFPHHFVEFLARDACRVADFDLVVVDGPDGVFQQSGDGVGENY